MEAEHTKQVEEIPSGAVTDALGWLDRLPGDAAVYQDYEVPGSDGLTCLAFSGTAGQVMVFAYALMMEAEEHSYGPGAHPYLLQALADARIGDNSSIGQRWYWPRIHVMADREDAG